MLLPTAHQTSSTALPDSRSITPTRPRATALSIVELPDVGFGEFVRHLESVNEEDGFLSWNVCEFDLSNYGFFSLRVVIVMKNDNAKEEDLDIGIHCGYADENRLLSHTTNRHSVAPRSLSAAVIVSSPTSTAQTSKQAATRRGHSAYIIKRSDLPQAHGHLCPKTASFDHPQPPESNESLSYPPLPPCLPQLSRLSAVSLFLWRRLLLISWNMGPVSWRTYLSAHLRSR
jgi:hypothetical protein